MMDLSSAINQPTTRRSMMMNHNGYEKLFFGQNGAIKGLDENDFYSRQKVQKKNEGAGHATIVMPMNFEGS